jgi:hypothetical protein
MPILGYWLLLNVRHCGVFSEKGVIMAKKDKFDVIAYGERLITEAKRRYGTKGICDIILQVPSGGFMRIWRKDKLHNWRYSLYIMQQSESFLRGSV